jgi:type I restriction enzyme S subunit
MKFKPYPEYKDSGVEWVGEIPKGWEYCKIKHLTDVKISNVDKKSKEYEPDVLLCNYTDVYNNEYIIDNLDFMKATASFEQINKLSLRKGDVLITKDSESADDIAVPALVTVDLDNVVCGYHLALIRPDDEIQGNYLFRLFESKQINDQFVVAANGVTRFGISTYPIKNSYLMVPSFKEQQKISSFLDKKTSEIDLTIEKDTRLIELLKEKRTALINHVVTQGLDPDAKMKDSGIEWIGEIPEGWEVRKIKDIASVKISNVDKKSKPNEPDVLLCNYTDVYNNEFITSELDFMKATANFEQIKKLSLVKDDVIVTKDSESPDDIAVPALVSENLDNVVCGYHLALIRPNKSYLDGNFLFRSLESKKINDQFVVAANGVTRFGISTYPIKNSYLFVPTLNEQKKISEYLENQIWNINITMTKIKENIFLLQEYKKSLIHHVVTGKVNVLKEDYNV